MLQNINASTLRVYLTNFELVASPGIPSLANIGAIDYTVPVLDFCYVDVHALSP